MPIEWVGGWAGTTGSIIPYYAQEIVNHDNIVYVVKPSVSLVPIGSPPPSVDSTNWSVFVAGDTGQSGATGPAGPTGAAGSSGTSGTGGANTAIIGGGGRNKHSRRNNIQDVKHFTRRLKSVEEYRREYNKAKREINKTKHRIIKSLRNYINI